MDKRSPVNSSSWKSIQASANKTQLATDPEMCMFALTVSTAEPKNIKEAMADSAWIEAMQEELSSMSIMPDALILAKSTSGGIQFLSNVDAGHSLRVWLQIQQNLLFVYDSQSAIAISCNPCAYSVPRQSSHICHSEEKGIQLSRQYRIEHPSDTYVLTMKMEILLEPTSNKLLVGYIKNARWLIPHSAGVGIHYHMLYAQTTKDTTKTFYKHQDSRIMKAQELKTKTSAQTLIYKIFLQRYQVYQGRLLASFQDDAKYEHVGQDTRSQGGKDDQDKQGKDLKISDIKTKSKDNDKGSRSKITKHEGTSLQRIQRPRPQDLNDKSNLIDLMKECHNELTSGEIVSLKILSRTRKFVHYIRSRSLN
ncbi:hypothetical protein Tco_0455345 [Tanacetum coccineum]